MKSERNRDRMITKFVLSVTENKVVIFISFEVNKKVDLNISPGNDKNYTLFEKYFTIMF